MNNFESLINQVKAFSELSAEEEQMINRYFRHETHPKNAIILNAGEICHKLYFLNKGLLRTFHTNQNGSEFTRLFCPENRFCTILISFTGNVPSAASIQCLEECELFSITFEDFKIFLSKSVNAQNIYTKILEEYQNFQIHRIEFLTSYTPQEKVDIFMKEHKNLLQRLTDKIIVTYLQITPETYSRSKKKLLH